MFEKQECLAIGGYYNGKKFQCYDYQWFIEVFVPNDKGQPGALLKEIYFKKEIKLVNENNIIQCLYFLIHESKMKGLSAYDIILKLVEVYKND